MKPDIIVKFILLALIVTVPFVPYRKYLSFFDATVAKVIMLLIIAAASFYNMELAILLTILFFLMLISAHITTIKKISTFVAHPSPPAPVPTFSLPSISSPSDDTKEHFIMSDFPDNECHITKETLQPSNPFAHFVDDKIKPYENYIHLIASQEHIEAASKGGVISDLL